MLGTEQCSADGHHHLLPGAERVQLVTGLIAEQGAAAGQHHPPPPPQGAEQGETAEHLHRPGAEKGAAAGHLPTPPPQGAEQGEAADHLLRPGAECVQHVTGWGGDDDATGHLPRPHPGAERVLQVTGLGGECDAADHPHLRPPGEERVQHVTGIGGEGALAGHPPPPPGAERVQQITGLGGEEMKLNMRGRWDKRRGPLSTYIKMTGWSSSSSPPEIERKLDQMRKKPVIEKENIKKQESKYKKKEDEDYLEEKKKDEEERSTSTPNQLLNSNICISRQSRGHLYLGVGRDEAGPVQDAVVASSSSPGPLQSTKEAPKEFVSPFGGGRSSPNTSTNGTLCASKQQLLRNVQFGWREDDRSRTANVRGTTAGSEFRNFLRITKDIGGKTADILGSDLD